MFKRILLLLLLLPGILQAQEIPDELFLGELSNYNKTTKELSIKNNSSEDKEFLFYSLCDCLTIEPRQYNIKPNEVKIFKVSLVPEGYDSISRHFLVDINGDKTKLRVFAKLPKPPTNITTSGCLGCLENEKEIADTKGAINLLNKWLIMDIYYSPGCTTCEEFIAEQIPTIEKTLEKNITINKHNVLESETLFTLENRLKTLNTPLEEFPILIFDNKVLQGSDVNENSFIKLYSSEEISKPDNDYKETIEYLKPAPILFAGLIDGINPCAFTTLLFLISSLFYVGRGKKEILYIGIIFSATIFVSYYLVGLGMLNIVRTANFFPTVSIIIKYILIVALITLGILSLYDAYKVKKGQLNSIKLQLPKSLKKRIHTVIKKNTRSRGMILGTIIIGVMVTIFELTCTGQVYLPIIAYIIKIEGSFSAYFYLTLYNLGFIAPLLAVFFTIYKGTTNQKIVTWFQNRLFLIKILLALFFFSMIIFL